jgi:hypothetical protein
MFKHTLWVLALFVAFAAGGSDASAKRLIIDPGIDTLPPQVTITTRDCGKVTLEATEVRNIPNPPTTPPGPNDQVDRGIASITITGAPSSYNARLVLVTDQNFPRDPSYKNFVFRIEAIDASKKAVAFVFVRDWADNATSMEITIEPQIPTPSTDLVDVKMRVNQTKDTTFTITNSTAQPLTISSITLNGSAKFTIVSGGTATPITLAAGEVRTITVRYAPDASGGTGGDQANVVISTPCGDKNVQLKGEALIGRIKTEDWMGVVHEIKLGGKNPASATDTTTCKPGFTITNEGNVAFQITDLVPNSPKVTISKTAPTLPYTLGPGMTVTAEELCISTSDDAPINAVVKVIGTFDAGDDECVVTTTGTTGVDEEAVRALNVRYDASSDVITFQSDRAAKLVNITGSVVAASQNSMINTNGLTTGAYFVIFESQPQMVVPVMVTH